MIKYEVYFREQQRRLPSQQELRRTAERRVGDTFLVKQPKDKSFAATHQRHSRGIWTDDTRKMILRDVRGSARLPSDDRKKELERLWRDNGMSWLRVSFDQLKRATERAQDTRKPVTPEVDKRTSKKFPGVAQFLKLMSRDRIINRGNAHMEIRSLNPNGKELIGWTLQTPGVMVQFLKSGKLEEAGRNKLLTFGKRVTLPGKDKPEVDRIQVTKKSSQPLVWLGLVTKKDPIFEAEIGQVGASEATAGRFDFITGGGDPFKRVGRGRTGFSVVYGVRRSNFHEQYHFYEDPELQKRIGGRWTFRILRLGGREDIPESTRWLARRADDARPFIFQNDFDTEVDQARKEKTDLFWNFDTVSTLEDLGYFKMFDLEEKLAEFKASPRGKSPPRNGVARFRPKGRKPKTPPPDIFGD